MLDEIIKHKRDEVAARVRHTSLNELERRVATAPAPRLFEPAQPMALIAEVKRRSPSQGDFVTEIDPVAQARAYANGGATAISVLTDERYFRGSFDDLTAVRSAIDLPVLCKDFILTSYQVVEARVHGADLALLIVAAIPDSELIELHRQMLDLGMLPLVEVHDQHDLARALAMNARMIGINNRDLSDFSVDLLTTEYLAPLVPDDVILVSESGITTRSDIERVQRAGARVVLVGEVLMRSSDPGSTIRELLA